MSNTILNSEVAAKSAIVERMQAAWEMARRLIGGTALMRQAGTQYLPKWPNEDQESYDARLATAVLFPAYSRTVKTLASKPFSKPMSWSKEPSSQIMEWCEDVDLQGRNLHSFVHSLAETAIGFGLTGILVDVPNMAPATDAEGKARTRTQQEEKDLGIRPYFVEIYPTQLLGWRSARKSGVEMLTQLRIMENVLEPEGEFGEKSVEQVKVLEPGQWRTYRVKKNAQGVDEWMIHAFGPTTLNVVPYIPVYGGRQGYMMGTPPMLELGYLNLKHWISQSDQDTILHVARVPVLTVSGVEQMDPEKKFELTLGGSAAVMLPVGGDMKYVEHTGAAIAAGSESLESLKEEMRQAGAELLVIKPAAVTATQVATEDSVGMCDLQRIAQGIEDSVDKALGLIGQYSNDSNTGKAEIHTDFGAASLAEASASLLHAMRLSGDLSPQTLFHEVQRRGIIAPDVDFQEEQERISQSGPPLGKTGPTDPPKEE